jgi:hypothetical protein
LYEVVVVTSTPSTRNDGIADRTGVVLGIARPDVEGRPVTYAVGGYDFDRTCMVAEDEIVSTGRIDSRNEFYTGESIRVTQKGELLGE